MMLSSWSTSSLEDVAQASGSGLRWFQLYVYRDQELTRNLILRAERAGYKAVVVTVDTPVLGRRLADARNRFDLPPRLSLANFSDTSAQSALVTGREADSGLHQYTVALIDPCLTWDKIDWLRGITKLPILLKGILTAEDAEEALRHNIQGIIVSNHGARQLDGVLATVSQTVYYHTLSATCRLRVCDISPSRLMPWVRLCELCRGGWRCTWMEG